MEETSVFCRLQETYGEFALYYGNFAGYFGLLGTLDGVGLSGRGMPGFGTKGFNHSMCTRLFDLSVLNQLS